MPHGPLVLGATGQVGQLLKGCAPLVWSVDPIWQTRRANEAGLLWDITKEDPPEVECSGIIMLAGGPGDPVDVHIALAEAACDLGERLGVRVLIASSQAVYDTRKDVVSEASRCAPQSEYGKAKLAMERAVECRDYVSCLRIGNVVGADHLMRSAATGYVPLEQWPDGTGPMRAMIGPLSLARALAGLLDCTAVPPILNLAQPGLVPMQSLVEELGVDWDWVPARAEALHSLEMDVSLARSVIPLQAPTAKGLIAEARLCGWEAA